jgi:hypothetical protein
MLDVSQAVCSISKLCRKPSVDIAYLRTFPIQTANDHSLLELHEEWTNSKRLQPSSENGIILTHREEPRVWSSYHEASTPQCSWWTGWLNPEVARTRPRHHLLTSMCCHNWGVIHHINKYSHISQLLSHWSRLSLVDPSQHHNLHACVYVCIEILVVREDWLIRLWYWVSAQMIAPTQRKICQECAGFGYQYTQKNEGTSRTDQKIWISGYFRAKGETGWSADIRSSRPEIAHRTHQAQWFIWSQTVAFLNSMIGNGYLKQGSLCECFESFIRQRR